MKFVKQFQIKVVKMSQIVLKKRIILNRREFGFESHAVWKGTAGLWEVFLSGWRRGKFKTIQTEPRGTVQSFFIKILVIFSEQKHLVEV